MRMAARAAPERPGQDLQTRLCPPVAPTSSDSYIVMFVGHSGSSAFTESLSKYRPVSKQVQQGGYEPLQSKEFLRNGSKGFLWTEKLFDAARSQGHITGFKVRPGLIPRRLIGNYHALFKEHNTRFILQRDPNVLRDVLNEMSGMVIACKVMRIKQRASFANCSESLRLRSACCLSRKTSSFSGSVCAHALASLKSRRAV